MEVKEYQKQRSKVICELINHFRIKFIETEMSHKEAIYILQILIHDLTAGALKQFAGYGQAMNDIDKRHQTRLGK